MTQRTTRPTGQPVATPPTNGQPTPAPAVARPDRPASRGTAGLDEIPFDEILAELDGSPLAAMLLQAIEASRDATDWAEQSSAEHAALAARHGTDRAGILVAAADAGDGEWKARAR